MEQNSMVAGSSWSWNHPELGDPAQVDLDPDPVLDPGPDPALDPGPGQDPGVAVTSLGIGLRAGQGQDHLRLVTGNVLIHFSDFDPFLEFNRDQF